MEYRRFGDTIIARLDNGEKITEQVKRLAEAEKITLATVEGLGSVYNFSVGIFDAKNKLSHFDNFRGAHEIVSLTGMINTKDGEFYSRLNISAADEDACVFGGHLLGATVNGSCELVIRVIDGRVDRFFDEDLRIDLLKFM